MNDVSQFAGDRISKVLARAGVCSRRDAERMIADGRVAVNGRRLDTPAFNVTADDKITVDGKPVGEPDPPRLWRYHKPAGLVTTARDPQGRDTVFQKLPASLPRVNAVGRLDINTEGLLLLTNDGGMKRFLELPSTGWLRRYRVRAFGRVDEGKLRDLKHGITIDGVNYKSIDAQLERVQGGNAWLNIALREGKNREIKRVLEALDLKVNRLIRLSFGPFQLGQLEARKVEEVPRRVLRQQLGKNWQAIVDGTVSKQEERNPEGAERAPRPPRQKATGGKSVGDKPFAGKPRGEKPRGDKPRGDKLRGEKPRGDRGRSDKRMGDKPLRGKAADRKPSDRKSSDRKPSNRDARDARGGEKPRRGKPSGARPSRSTGPIKPKGQDAGRRR
ncbi:MAG: pseudouridine synthase [Parvibaculales bacterium]